VPVGVLRILTFNWLQASLLRDFLCYSAYFLFFFHDLGVGFFEELTLSRLNWIDLLGHLLALLCVGSRLLRVFELWGLFGLNRVFRASLRVAGSRPKVLRSHYLPTQNLLSFDGIKGAENHLLVMQSFDRLHILVPLTSLLLQG
jgi:hypothetical protein